MQVINLAEKFKLFHEHWQPRIVGEVNDAYVKLVKFQGDFVWHQHADEDELFLVVRGTLTIKVRERLAGAEAATERALVIQPGEFVVIPKGVEHCPAAPAEVEVVLLEPKATRNTGDVENDRTIAAAWL